MSDAFRRVGLNSLKARALSEFCETSSLVVSQFLGRRILYTIENFLAMHRHVFRCLDADSYLIPFNAKHRDGDIVTDHE